MKTVLIIHGFGGHAGIHWQQWLSNQLEAQGHKVLMPDMPEPDHPDRKVWLEATRQTLAGVNLGQLTIVGHSLGVVTALDFIEQADSQVNRLLSVAGFAKDYGSEEIGYFLSERIIDFESVKDKLRWAAVIYGDNDPRVPQAALKYLADSLGVQPVIVPNGGHLNSEAGFTEFPRLVELLR
ncbi:MAG TPA: alpha/beta fold hydrolase [Candidatus Dormibacteraeota bacterium]|nr:alpha/beta fold hydrolase [Candidatus Dormibacteraeota bacterium]